MRIDKLDISVYMRIDISVYMTEDISVYMRIDISVYEPGDKQFTVKSPCDLTVNI